MYTTLATERQGPISLITLNRPERHNAFDDVSVAELTAALNAAGEDPSVRVVVLSGAGKSFSAGADLHWMRRAAKASRENNERDAQALATMLRTLAELPKPTVARVQGAAYGGGVGLVACCDVAVAMHTATFAVSEVKLGLIPAVISPYLLTAIGPRWARRYFLSGERFEAGDAWRMGLVHEIVLSEEQLDERIGAIVESLLECGPGAQAECKALIRELAGQPITPEQTARTAAWTARVRSGPEALEGIAAFLDKRRAGWLPPPPEPEPEDAPPPGA